MSITFDEWKNEHSQFMRSHVVQTENSRWGRVISNWNEERTGSNQTLEHIYTPAINLKNGDIYLDCGARKIWAKCCLYSILQPIVLTVKTVYHLFLPFSIPYTIYKTVQAAKNEENKISEAELMKKIIKEVGKNLVDMVRTPLYAIAITIVGIAGVIIGPFAPKLLYDIRITAGKLDKSLNWDENSPWILFRCFQPIDNLMTIDQWDREYKDTAYLKENEKDDPILLGLTNYSRAQIKFRRDNHALFNDCCQKYPQDKPFVSKSFQK